MTRPPEPVAEIRSILEGLEPRARFVLYMRYLTGATYQQIRDELGLQRERARQRIEGETMRRSRGWLR